MFQSLQLEMVKSQLAKEKSRNVEATEELETLRARLDALDVSIVLD